MMYAPLMACHKNDFNSTYFFFFIYLMFCCWCFITKVSMTFFMFSNALATKANCYCKHIKHLNVYNTITMNIVRAMVYFQRWYFIHHITFKLNIFKLWYISGCHMRYIAYKIKNWKNKIWNISLKKTLFCSNYNWNIVASCRLVT